MIFMIINSHSLQITRNFSTHKLSSVVMVECFLSSLSVFTSHLKKGPAFTVQCSLEMLINRQLSPDPDPRRKAATNDDVVAGVCECACVHVCTVHTC